MLTQLGRVIAGGTMTKYLAIAMAVVALAATGAYLHTKSTASQLETALIETKIEVDQLSSQITGYKFRLEKQGEAQVILNERITQERKEAEALSDQLEGISNAPKEDDGDVSNVLRNAIDRLPNN